MPTACLRDQLAYEPVALAFGTSGLRGLVRDITQLEAFINTAGFLEYLLGLGAVRPGEAVCFGGDLRPSTTTRDDAAGGRGEILQAVAAAIDASGLEPVFFGLLPTPALMHASIRRGRASVMVTGSHIPFDRNGIKFNKPDGEVLKSDEQPILEAVAAVRKREYGRAAAASWFDERGMIREPHHRALPEVDPSGLDTYRQRYLQAFPADALEGLRLLVYQHSAVGRDLLADLLAALGAEVTRAGRSEAFIPVDTEAVNESMIKGIQALVEANGGGGRFDAVVSTDGDSDRPLLLYLAEGRLQFVPGDLLGVVTADALGVRHVAVPISVTDAVDRHLSARGVAVVKTRIGSPHVIAAMREVGWEANGGFLTAIPIKVPDGGVLDPLPTRDAVLPILTALHAARRRRITPAGLFATLPRRFGRSDLLREFPRETSLRILGLFKPELAGVEEVRFGPNRIETRSTGEAMVALREGDPLARELAGCRARLEQWFGRGDGFGRVTWINYLDGVRIGFERGEIVHVRPSGNAPELRVYACADHAERVAAIARLAVGEKGLLRRIAASLNEGQGGAAALPG